MFRLLHIIVCRSQKFRYDTLNIISDITCFRQRCGVRNCQRHIQKLRQCLDQISLTTACRSDHKHIGFLNINIVHRVCCNSLIMIVYSYRHNLLGMFLTYHILIQRCLDLMRCRNLLKIQYRLGLLFFLLRFDLLLLHRI